jgi:hypothetical protein
LLKSNPAGISVCGCRVTIPTYLPSNKRMTKQQVLDLYFLDARHKLIELAAFPAAKNRKPSASSWRSATRRWSRLTKPPPRQLAERFLEKFEYQN